MNLSNLQANVVMTVDPKAINYILTHSHDYPKPEMTRFALSKIVGPGMSTGASLPQCLLTDPIQVCLSLKVSAHQIHHTACLNTHCVHR